MNKYLRNAIASATIEGLDFSEEKIRFIESIANRLDSGEITWEQAKEIIIKERLHEHISP